MKFLETLLKTFQEMASSVYNRLWKDLKEDPIRTVYTLIMVYLIGAVIIFSVAKIYVEISKKQVNIIIEPEDLVNDSIEPKLKSK
jgi:hypothetical protein